MTSLLRMLWALLALICISGVMLAGCATLQPSQTRFEAALQAAVTQQTQQFVAWHPDVATALVQLMHATCASLGGVQTVAAYQAALLGQLDALHFPEPTNTQLRQFVPLLVAVVPLALRVAGLAVPQVGTAELAVQDVCIWTVQTAQEPPMQGARDAR